MKATISQQFLFDTQDLQSSYTSIYTSLSRLREVFHKSGRFDDSNAKLDEVIKFIATYIAYKRGLIDSFPSIVSTPKQNLISGLEKAFKEAARLPCYLNQDEVSIFGKSPSLILQEGDEDLTIEILQLVENAIDAAFANKKAGQPFDILNEAFGHFIRDNFRGNIEDAQYMTPPEVVDFAVNLALHDLEKEGLENSDDVFVVADSSCGVGSFLTAFYHKAKALAVFDDKNILLVGQDKVERMTRLSKVNLTLFESSRHQITIGNSLSSDSALSDLNGKIDLIITNPPFGAKFNFSDIKNCGSESLPFFYAVSKHTTIIDSELLFIDRNLALLKEDGLLFVVLPDSVISAKGLPSLLRQYLRQNCIVRAIIELPSVTFAQAGTRTKTALLYLQKKTAIKDFPKNVFLAKAEQIGFEVSSRKGVQIKSQEGANELPEIFNSYKISSSYSTSNDTHIISENPSAVSVSYGEILENSWTPNHYNAVRLKSINSFKDSKEINNVPLEDLVEFKSLVKRVESWQPETAFISVLHIIGEGLLDIPNLKNYAPKTAGFPVKAGDLLLSKINPRIPRAIVVPKLADRILCSTEFEVMKPKDGLDPYLLSFLLLSRAVQDQIKSLTSGTSASHNRIKTKELAKVSIPIPLKNSGAEQRLQKIVENYKNSFENLVQETINISSLRTNEAEWMY